MDFLLRNPAFQANYHYNASIQKYQLVKKNCTTVTEAGWCREDCHIQTGFNDDQFCCCSGDLCNQNVTFSDPSKVDNMSKSAATTVFIYW